MKFEMNKKAIITALLAIAALSLASCSSDEPQWADPEAHEKTEQLRAQYEPFIIGTWHIEKTIEKQRAYEQLTFNADGTFCGRRKWQSRQVVTIGGQEQYTDWEDIPDENGTFTGTWKLRWERYDNGAGANRIILYANWDNNNQFMAYGDVTLFGFADENNLQFAGYWRNSNGWSVYERGEAEPSF